MTQTAQPDPFDDLLARVQRLEDGAASIRYVQAIQDRMETLEIRLKALERAVPIAEPGPRRTGPPVTTRSTSTTTSTVPPGWSVAGSREEASQREEEAIRRAGDALLGRSSDPLTARLDAMAAKLDEVLRRLGGFPFT